MMLLDARYLFNQSVVIGYLAREGTESPDGHTARKSRCRNQYRTLGSPFYQHLFGIDKQHFRPQAAVKTELESL